MPEELAAPAHDEVEFSAFGPGYGESLLVHLGENEWLLVDSCLNDDGSHPALGYLRAMNVKPAERVKLIVATHWHDDHIRGMAGAVDTCMAAKFACSEALSPREIVQAIGSYMPPGWASLTSGVEEMRRVFELLVARTPRAEAMWVVERRPLYERHGAVPCRVMALSPSDRMVRESHEGISGVIARGTSGRVPVPNLNLGAVVLLVEVGDAGVLLGADLQEVPGGGWTAVMACLAGGERQCEIFKVPHHGSVNGHLENVWTTMVTPEPQAVLCPHHNGRNHLPTPADLARLCNLAHLHVTSSGPPAPTWEHGRLMHPSIGPMGRVTLRRRVGAVRHWSVTYDGAASEGCASIRL